MAFPLKAEDDEANTVGSSLYSALWHSYFVDFNPFKTEDDEAGLSYFPGNMLISWTAGNTGKYREI